MPNPVQWSPVFDVNGLAGGASEGQVTVLANGDIVAVWKQATPGSDFDIFMRHFDAGGQPKGEAVQVNVTDLGWQEKPVVTALTNGGFAIPWVDQEANDDNDVRYRIYDKDGKPQTEDKNVYGSFDDGNNQKALTITAMGSVFAIGFVGSETNPTDGVHSVFTETGENYCRRHL